MAVLRVQRAVASALQVEVTALGITLEIWPHTQIVRQVQQEHQVEVGTSVAHSVKPAHRCLHEPEHTLVGLRSLEGGTQELGNEKGNARFGRVVWYRRKHHIRLGIAHMLQSGRRPRVPLQLQQRQRRKEHTLDRGAARLGHTHEKGHTPLRLGIGFDHHRSVIVFYRAQHHCLGTYQHRTNCFCNRKITHFFVMSQPGRLCLPPVHLLTFTR